MTADFGGFREVRHLSIIFSLYRFEFHKKNLFFTVLNIWRGTKKTRLRAPKMKFKFFDDFERQKHALSNGPMHKAVRSKVTEI